MPSVRFLWRSGGFQKGTVKQIKVQQKKIINYDNLGSVDKWNNTYLFCIWVEHFKDTFCTLIRFF